ncbi:aldo/keto reductase [Aestuariibacter salexigens]|uniref:aldo/keto reductase n=1 Tax=Aestuariibacter salexigens TaxID=226010 RepID=UPI00040823E5|nr:aldo/keto reductase [Aestuariibacter salexigens]
MAVTYKRLGKSGVLVSNLCLGTMNFGWHTSKKDSFAIMDRALELGINFFDTADVYGWETYHGYTEEIIGEWIAQGGQRRENIILATKVYNPAHKDKNDTEPNRSGTNLSSLKIRRHLEASLKRLQTDVIDLYQVHHIDRQCSWEEAWDAFNDVQTQGKAIYIGTSNFPAWQIASACEKAKQRHRQGLVSEQSVYNLNNRHVELEVLPACENYGLGFIPYSPVAGGLLAGALEKEKQGRRGGEWLKDAVIEERQRIADYEDLCREIGADPAIVAMAWLFHNPIVTAPIIGPRTMKHLEDAVAATELRLDEEALARLDKLFPGPGGPAPEAYAW